MRAIRKTRRGGLLLLGAAAVATLAIAGCGGGDKVDKPRPPVAVELTGVIQAKTVTVSPDRVGAGPIVITISNQTQQAHTVTLEGGSVQEEVGPINPFDTATLQKTLSPGTYRVSAGSAAAVTKEIAPATLRIGPERANSDRQLLLP